MLQNYGFEHVSQSITALINLIPVCHLLLRVRKFHVADKLKIVSIIFLLYLQELLILDRKSVV